MNRFEYLIDNAKLEERVDLSEVNDIIKSVKFEISSEGYIWSAKHWKLSSHIYPMRSQTYVKFFKTLSGAKRNFIRQYGKFFEE